MSTVMLASGTLLFLLAGAAPLADDGAVDEALRKFRSDYHRPGVRDEDRIRAVGALAGHRHEKVARALAPLLTQAPLTVRIVAARRLEHFSGVPGVAEDLRSALTHYRNGGQSARGVRITILRALGTLRASGAAEEVDRRIGDADVWVAKAAIEAAGKIRAGSSVDALVKALARLDGPSGDRDVALDLFEGDLPATGTMAIIRREAEERDKRHKTQRQVLRDPLLSALTSITRVSFSDTREWRSWWRTRKRDFVVPP